MRSILFLIILAGLVPLCVLRPYVGVLAWSWISYMNPHRLTWSSFTYNFPAAFVIGLATLFGLVLMTLGGKGTRRFPLSRESLLLSLLWLLMTVSQLFAIYPDEVWGKWGKISKIFLMTFVTVLLIDNQKKLRLLFLVIVFSIGFFGVKGAVFSIVSGGQNLVFGPADSFVTDNNALALALNMIIPIAWYLAKEESNKWVRMALLVTFAGSILAVIFTYSRSGFLGLATVMMLLFMKANLGRKVLGAIALSFALIFALILVPQKWYSRMSTIETYDQDRSAMGRIEAWKLAWRIAIDRPFTGGGFGVINHKTLYDKYYAEAGIRTGVHSAYFEVLAESGFVAFGVFISLLFFSLLTLRKIRRRISRFPDAHWVANICNMLEISIIAYGVCGAFLELASFDLIYHLVAAVMIIRLLAEQHYRQATGLQVASVPAAARSAERVAQGVPLGVAGKSV